MKSIETARACCIQKGESRGRSQHHAAAVERGVSYVICQKAIGAAQHLLLSAQLIKEHQAVGRSYRNHAVCRVRQDTIDAEHIVIFIMGGAAQSGTDEVKPVIEVS